MVPTSSTDFPDGAQRFNWCNCQDSVTARPGLSGAVVSPPLFDFNHWNAVLTGGGGATATDDPAAASSLPTAVQTVSPYLLAAAAGALLLLLTRGGKGRK